jgi:large subunit ribosomal protein L13
LAKEHLKHPDSVGQIIVDARNCIAGRLCSHVSKLLLDGGTVTIVNAEMAMVSGKRHMTIENYKVSLEINSATNPIHGPFHPRRPDKILTKMVRGMLPKRRASGVEAMKRLRVYIGTPIELTDKNKETFVESKITRPESNYTAIGDIAAEIGWKGVPISS